MLKADAYNHGAVEIARYVVDDVDWFGVANLEEGIKLRTNGIEKPILVSVFSISDCDGIVKYNLAPLIHSISQAKMLEYYGKCYNKKVRTHIKIDTGMNRLGIKTRKEYLALYEFIKSSNNLIIDGICTHYYDTNPKIIFQQDELFRKIIGTFEKDIIYHTASSNAMILTKDTHYDMVRVGLSAYGYSDYNDNFQPVMQVLSSVIAIKDVKKGEISGYNTFLADTDTKVAIIRGGYYDGITRDMVGCFVIINNKLCKIVAVCMDMSIVDIKDYKININDNVIVQGTMSSNNNNAKVLANQLVTIPYEILTKFKGRIKRVYYE